MMIFFINIIGPNLIKVNSKSNGIIIGQKSDSSYICKVLNERGYNAAIINIDESKKCQAFNPKQHMI